MCCFSKPVQGVEATNIFARSLEETRQVVVYSMTLRAREDLAMILPIPVRAGAGERAVTFIDFSAYPDFFVDLGKGFPVAGNARALPPRSKGLGGAPPKLEVVPVGSFEASFVPSVKDFERLDARFRLPPAVWQGLPQYANHGFAVFKLKAGAAKIHPMAFSFPRANPKELFFPTVHIHDGQVHPRAEFDHVLYAQRAGADDFNLLDWDESYRPAAAFMKLDKVPNVLTDDHCYRKTLSGDLPNRDTVLM